MDTWLRILIFATIIISGVVLFKHMNVVFILKTMLVTLAIVLGCAFMTYLFICLVMGMIFG